MKKIKKLSFLIIALFMSIILVSCGNNNSNKNNDNDKNNNLPPTYSVSFKVDDTILKTLEIPLNEKITEPETPEKTDYVFMGWYNGENKWDFQKNIVTDNLILIAKFLGEYDEDGYKVISTKEKLKEYALNKDYYSVNARLYADINLGGIEWIPIGDSNNCFTAIFDGNGFTISNFKITKCEFYSSNTLGYIGLFGMIENAEIINLSLKNYTIDVCYNNLNNDVFISAGGLVGFAFNSKIENCSTTDNISIKGTNNFVGGLIGSAYDTVTIKNCFAKGNVTVNSLGNSWSFAGGLIGEIYDNATIINCYATGKTNSYSEQYRAYSGGLIAYCQNNSKISSCYATGNASATSLFDNAYSAGLIAFIQDSEISNCYSTSNATTNGSVYAFSGGLIGYLKSTKVSYCYATGKIESLSSYESVSGGLIGYINESLKESEVSHCYAVGNVYAKIYDNDIVNTYAGGLVGSSYSSKIINNSYRFIEQEIISTHVNNSEKSGVINYSGTMVYMLTIWNYTLESWYKDVWNVFSNQNPTLK